MDEKMQKELEMEVYKGIKGGIKKIPPIAWFVIPCLLAAGLFVFSLNFRLHAQATGGMLGQGTGTLVGRAVGSLDGLTRGQVEGYEAGKAEGLSAKDTTAELSGKIKEVGKLEVLVASGTFSDVMSIGPEDKPNYAALLYMKYNAIFTVDLSTADIDLREDGLHITLEEPIVEFIPIGEIEKKNEYQKRGYIFKPGSAEAGYDAFNNSANQMREKATAQLQQDASMMKAARSSAETQLKQIVNAVSLSKPLVIIDYREGEPNE